ncbi:four helix bundle protein [Elizabethkingia meningoseptica]|uniref:four helix bundle protein n=2 Tax=Elizabethkingia meningoseptica TaxID=238 RepID=UPI000937C339|nr:four helix bundle protein [Elizabethkingia meningoseptica]MCL1674994.1 four helix bundle protein [Elizabethkingia meningoseptica]MCL1685638.1 four helix bundle protein [Elizabethkingia meningoseptica]MDE5436527.1 four helix bundle protein [Elizabethkingia meningoseptica]MDE5487492.1 four helix bundle protein [Elizabethkingia meningoseptica]MDE5492416.1 four helix bundle protein [Elizabethkingia meningoseptica]
MVMKEDNIIKQKSFNFAIRIIKLYQYLSNDKKEFILSKQILRSGTSIGAMVRESEHAQSKSDFIHKLSIAQKEINETIYWLELFQATDYLSKQEFESINEDAVEIIKLITSIIKTTKNNLNN